MMKLLLISILILAVGNPAFAEDVTWPTLVNAIEKLGMSQDVKDEFMALCRENDAAFIDGRIDTGDGLFMVMDVPVFNSPGKSREVMLEDGDPIVLTGEKSEVDTIEWVQIKYLHISSYTKMAVAIDTGWIESAQIKQ